MEQAVLSRLTCGWPRADHRLFMHMYVVGIFLLLNNLVRPKRAIGFNVRASTPPNLLTKGSVQVHERWESDWLPIQRVSRLHAYGMW
jgi:hypothetical protein